MNRKRSLGKLKIACIVTLILGIALFGFVAPQVVDTFYAGYDSRAQAPRRELIVGGEKGFTLTYVEIVGALCFLSLWQAWKICGEIGRDNSFSRENAKSLKRISRYMLVACIVIAVGWAFSLYRWNLSMLNGLSALGVCISLIFSLFAAAMAELIEAGAKLKDENDLTI